ncbi:hypothetical protein CRG98_011060 [Punica granatum]|uniref:Uncharacterized protein n=1 Tax=Punica granatum TaxID=22663 RepID=A0A2I0KJ89_PUNGR|nr:hypothetical protein CRG98_011060 [Punica granatum]
MQSERARRRRRETDLLNDVILSESVECEDQRVSAGEDCSGGACILQQISGGGAGTECARAERAGQCGSMSQGVQQGKGDKPREARRAERGQRAAKTESGGGGKRRQRRR